MLLAGLVLMALTRAEIIERFRSPVVTQADGLVKVYADCPEDMRREFQSPIARFAADTVQTLYQGLAKKPVRFGKPGIVISVGDVRTNLADVVTSVTTNDGRVVTRLKVKAPGYADLYRLRLEVIRGFYRAVEGRELSEDEAVAAYRQGKASRRDVLIFASRLYLYPPQRDVRLAGKYESLSFREAAKFGRIDPLTRLVAYQKANDLPVLGGGRGEELSAAAMAYRTFLLELAAAKKSEEELLDLLEAADTKLNVAYEKCEM